jgi:integrase
MACIRKRRGKFVVDFRDAAGVRRWVTCDTRREAEQALAGLLRERRQTLRPEVDPEVTFVEYAQRWLKLLAPAVKPRTLKSYHDTLRLHLVPVFGATRLRQLHKSAVRSFLAEKLTSGLSRNSVRIMHATVRAMLNTAVDDGVLLANPADRLGKHLRLASTAAARDGEVKALSRDQLRHFLGVTRAQRPQWHVFFLTLARTGLRLGEAFALQWNQVNFEAREIHVVQALSAGRIEAPKSGRTRTVDMSQTLTELLKQHHALRQPGAGDLVFHTRAGTVLDQARVGRVFKRALRAAGLPEHFTPHSLRHTFASLLLQQGESPVYVQRQLGHASIQLTVDTYGKWLPMGNKAAVDRLDDLAEGPHSRDVTASAEAALAAGARRGEPAAALATLPVPQPIATPDAPRHRR